MEKLKDCIRKYIFEDETLRNVSDMDAVIRRMTFESYRIDYSLDSKGFYQPNYVFSCILDGVQEEIHIPAIR